MSASKFSSPFMDKNPLSPLKGNAFIKAKMDAEAAGNLGWLACFARVGLGSKRHKRAREARLSPSQD